jgi:hypothetical protein
MAISSKTPLLTSCRGTSSLSIESVAILSSEDAAVAEAAGSTALGSVRHLASRID